MVSLMFSFRAPLLSVLPLGSSCAVGVHCVPSALLLSSAFGGFVCLLSTVVFLLSRFSGYLARPAFVSPCFRSLSSTASSSSSALSSSSVPCAGPPGVSPVTASSSAGRPASLSYVVAAASSSFLRVFTSCYRFVGRFSSWRGFAGVL